VAISAVAYLGLGPIVVAFMFAQTLTRRHAIWKLFVYINSGPIAVALVALLLLGLDFLALIPIVFFGALILVVDLDLFLLPWLRDKKANPKPASFHRRIFRAYRARRHSSGPKIPPLFRRANTIIFATMLLAVLSIGAGYGNARTKKEFFVDKATSLALIKQYGGTYVFLPVNEADQTFQAKVVLVSGDDISGKELERIRLDDPKRPE
jgi:hypothetical protein